jgi:hypothetical protein
MTISRAEIASNTSEIEDWIFVLLQRLQASSNNIFEVKGNGDYREVKSNDFNILYAEGVIAIKDETINVFSNGTYEKNGEKKEYVSHMFPIFFEKLKKLLLDYKKISANNAGFIETK